MTNTATSKHNSVFLTTHFIVSCWIKRNTNKDLIHLKYINHTHFTLKLSPYKIYNILSPTPTDVSCDIRYNKNLLRRRLQEMPPLAIILLELTMTLKYHMSSQ